MSARSEVLYWRSGHKVFELLPREAAHKGHALERLAGRLGRPFRVAVGDDTTDEDMFKALAGGGIGVRVGRQAGSKAGYFLAAQAEVPRLIRFISSRRSQDRNLRRGGIGVTK